jgi:hypothetical protein
MAATLKLGDRKWATKEGSLLAYNSENNNYKPLPFDFTRASSATRVNKQGLIETVQSGVPRIDFTDANGALKLEPQRTNLITYSEDFSNASWLKNQATVAITSDIAPDGTTNSVYNYVGNNSNLYTISQAAGVEYTISFYVKSNGQGADGFKFRLGSGYSASLSATSEWVRHTFTATPATSVFSIASDGVNDVNILVYGAQLELGSYATSYIPTQGSAVTRIAEYGITNSIPSLFGSTEGSFYIELKSNYMEGIPLFLESSDSAGYNWATYLQLGATSITYQVYSAGVSQVSINSVGHSAGDTLKIACAYKNNDFVMYVNGQLAGTNTSGVISTNLNKYAIGRYPAGGTAFQYNGNVNQALLFTTRLSNAELIALTTI